MALVRVTDTATLQAALETAYTDPGRIIEIAPGDYPFRGYALAHLGPPGKGRPVRDLTVRGLGGAPQDVVIHGSSMDNDGIPGGYGLMLSEVNGVHLEGLTIRDVKQHGIAIKGENGATFVTLTRCHVINTGAQHVKGTANKPAGIGPADCAFTDCYFAYTPRDYIDKNIELSGGPILECPSATQVRLKSSPANLDRTSYPAGYWVGAVAEFPGAGEVGRTVVASEPWGPYPSHQVLSLDGPVPSDATRVLLTLDRPDEIIPGAWGPQGGYTNGIDLHHAKRTRITRCTFDHIGTSLTSSYGHSVPAILLWGGCVDSTVEDCWFYNCESGIALGMGNRDKFGPTGVQHRQGRVRNAWFYREASVRGDRAVGFDCSPDNLSSSIKAVLNGTYRHAVEYRFEDTVNSVLLHLETDAAVPVAQRPEDTPAPLTCGIISTVDADAVRAEVLSHVPTL